MVSSDLRSKSRSSLRSRVRNCQPFGSFSFSPSFAHEAKLPTETLVNERNGANGECRVADSNGAACHRKRRCWKPGKWALAARLFAGVILAGLGVGGDRVRDLERQPANPVS